MHQILFRPDPADGAYSAPPDPLAEFNGPTSKGRERGEGREREWRERREREERKCSVPPPTFE